MKYVFSILLFVFTLSYGFVKAETSALEEQTVASQAPETNQTPAPEQKIEAPVQPVVEAPEAAMPEAPITSLPEDEDDDSGFLDLDDIPDNDIDE